MSKTPNIIMDLFPCCLSVIVSWICRSALRYIFVKKNCFSWKIEPLYYFVMFLSCNISLFWNLFCINIATPTSFLVHVACYIFFLPFCFQPIYGLIIKLGSLYKACSWTRFPFSSLSFWRDGWGGGPFWQSMFLHCVLKSFIFNVIIAIFGLNSTPLLAVFYLFHMFFFLFFTYSFSIFICISIIILKLAFTIILPLNNTTFKKYYTASLSAEIL